MRKLLLLLFAGCCACPSPGANLDLKQSKFTQVVNDVQVISTADNARHPAAVDALFKMPDVLRTGTASRAEMVAEDRTITRVGANTIFSFDPANRSVDLKQGSLLFNSPKGKGGGSIHTAAATAAVLGTTIIVVATPDGGFKVLTLEGVAEVRFLKGVSRRLRAGQLIFVLPGSVPGPVLAFRLDQQIAGSKLVTGFNQPLPSLPLIQAQIARQIQLIQSGHAQDTGFLIGNHASQTTVEMINLNQTLGGGTNGGPNGMNILGPGTPPPGIIAQNGGFLNPDGFLFTSFATNRDGGVGPGPAFAAGPATATLSDATISTPTLDATRLFTSELQVTVPQQPGAPGFISGGFFARNLTIATPSIDLSAINLLGLQNFLFFASENLAINNNLMLTPFDTALIFFAGGQLSISPGVTITGNADSLQFDSTIALNLNNVTIANSGEELVFNSFGPITLNNSSLTSATIGIPTFLSIANSDGGHGDINLNNTPLNGDNVSVNSAGALNVTGATPAAGQISSTVGVNLTAASGMTVGVNITSDAVSGSISLFNTSGLLTVNNGAQISAGTINVDSPGGVLIDSITTPQAAIMNIGQFSAISTATIQNTDMSGLDTLNVAAQTVVLINMTLPSSGNSVFSVANHTIAPGINTSQPVIPGDLNIVSNVKFQGALLTAGNVGLALQVR